MKSDIDKGEPSIGDCVYVLYHKLWGKTLVKRKLKSQGWWQQQLAAIINGPVIELPKTDWEPGIYDQSGNPMPAPLPFEVEADFPDLDYDTLFKAWRKTFG